MKRLFPILLIALSACTHTNNWVQELESKNPLKDSTEYISVYIRFDTIINDFEVSGILYPYYSEQYGWSMYENGYVCSSILVIQTKNIFGRISTRLVNASKIHS